MVRAVQLETVQIPRVWTAGYRGEGVGIAVLDSGIGDHADLSGRVAHFEDFVQHKTEPYDDMGHGTATAAMAAGSGAASHGFLPGAAPAATLIGLKIVGPDNHIRAQDLARAIHWAVDNQKRYNIRVLNMSIGVDEPTPQGRAALQSALERATDAGIIPVAAAGNDGPGAHSIRTLASFPHVITVAAFDSRDTIDSSDDTIWEHSSRGPGIHLEAKPDVSAPGVNVWIAATDGGYCQASATSFAAPCVSGIIATWLQANPALHVEDIRHILQATSRPITNIPPQAQGAGEIRAWDGLRMAQHIVQPPAAVTPRKSVSSSNVTYLRGVTREPLRGR